MVWIVETTAVFDEWLTEQSEALQDEMLSALIVLGEFGPNLGRPLVDTLKGSAITNLKELRVQFAGKPMKFAERLYLINCERN